MCNCQRTLRTLRNHYILRELVGKTCLVYVDDIIVFAETPKELVTNIGEVLKRLSERGIKLSAKKAVLYAREVKWCGKILSGTGVSQDPERVSGLLDLRKPTTVAELMSFLCSVNWMRLHIPELTKIVAPLQDLLQEALKGKKRTKRSAAKIIAQFQDEHHEAWDAVRNA